MRKWSIPHWPFHGPSLLTQSKMTIEVPSTLGRPVSSHGLSRKFKASQAYRGRQYLKEAGVRENGKERV